MVCPEFLLDSVYELHIVALKKVVIVFEVFLFISELLMKRVLSRVLQTFHFLLQSHL